MSFVDSEETNEENENVLVSGINPNSTIHSLHSRMSEKIYSPMKCLPLFDL